MQGTPVVLGLTATSMNVESVLKVLDDLPAKERFTALVELPIKGSNTDGVKALVDQAIVKTGQSGAIPYAEGLMKTRPGLVMPAVEHAVQKKDATEEFRAAMIKLLAPYLNGKEGFSVSSGGLVSLLAKLNPVETERLLVTPEYLSASSPSVLAVLELLNQRNRQAPRPLVEELLRTQWSEKFDRSNSSLYIEAAKALYLHDSAAGEKHLRAVILQNNRISKVAADALLERRKFPRLRYGADVRMTKAKLETLGKVEQTAWLADHYNDVMMLGGLVKMDDEDDAPLAPGMIEALKHIGAPKAAARLQEFATMFWPDGAEAGKRGTPHMIATYGENWKTRVEAIIAKYPDLENTVLLGLDYLLAHEAELKK